MFARKSEKQREVVEKYVYRRQHVHVFRPELDTRVDLFTHGGAVLRPGPYLTVSRVPRGALIYPCAPDETTLVVFDEAQLFDTDDVVHWVKAHDKRGMDVLISCLDRDSKGEPFGPIKEFLFIADKVKKRVAVCVCCGGRANRTQRLVDATDRILIGEGKEYEARCAVCHRP